MPTIKQLFGPDQVDDPDFDLDAFLAEAGTAVSGSAERQFAHDGVVPPEPAPSESIAPGVGSEEPGVGAGDVSPPPGTEPAPPPEPLPPAVVAPPDPLAGLPPERRAALLALDQAIGQDPDIARRVFEAARPAEPAARPELPPEIPADSFEGRMWQQQQAILDRLDAEAAERKQTTAIDAQRQRALLAAGHAASNFSSRYPGLEATEVQALAVRAGSSGIAGALASRPGADLVTSYEEALEHALWTDPALRAKVGGTTPPPPPAAPAATTNEGNKRLLHALSGAASPVSGPPAARQPLETRTDGSLTPRSKGLLVEQLASDLRNKG